MSHHIPMLIGAILTIGVVIADAIEVNRRERRAREQAERNRVVYQKGRWA